MIICAVIQIARIATAMWAAHITTILRRTMITQAVTAIRAVTAADIMAAVTIGAGATDRQYMTAAG